MLKISNMVAMTYFNASTFVEVCILVIVIKTMH